MNHRFKQMGLQMALLLGLITFIGFEAANATCLDALPFTAGFGSSYETSYGGTPPVKQDGAVTVSSSQIPWLSLYNWANVGPAYVPQLQATIHVKDMVGNHSLGIVGCNMATDSSLADYSRNALRAVYVDNVIVDSAAINTNGIYSTGSINTTSVSFNNSIAVMVHKATDGTYYLDFYSVNYVGASDGPAYTTLYDGTHPTNAQAQQLISEQGSVPTLTYTQSVAVNPNSVVTLSGAYNAIFLNSDLVFQSSSTAPTGSLTVDKNMVGQNGQVAFNWSVTPTN